MIVKKKTWPESFEKILSGDKRFELRLADFELNEGDTLVLEEYDPKEKKFTGRKIEKQCKSVTKVNPTVYNKAEDIEKHGLYLIGLE